MRFEVKDRDGLARIGVLETRHGKVETPTLLPVINPNRMVIEPKEMKKLFKIDILITNSYIIYKNKRLKEFALSKGVHKLLDFDGAIMTDSGTFQSYVYGDVDVDPIEIVEFQRDIGSDIGTILDLFTNPEDSYNEAKRKVKETIKRARVGSRIKGEMLLACPVQGGVYEDLRKACAREMGDIDCEVHPIGGVVPLMEQQRYDELTRVITSSKRCLPPSRVIHLFGAGHPLVFPLAIALGVDLVDSASYAKYARDDRLIFPWGTEKLEDLEEIPCSCPVCTKTDIKELKEMDKVEREKKIALHNLYICFSEMKRVKVAIKEGSLWELVEEKSSLNPMLFDALRVLEREGVKDWLERFESLSKNSALFYVNSHTLHRPIIYRYQRRLFSVYRPREKEVVLKEEVEKPYSRYYRKEWEKSKIDIIVKTPFGPVPLPLDEMYPIAQSMFPKNIDEESKMFSERLVKNFLERFGLKEINEIRRGKRDLDLDRVRYVIDMQFGKGVSDILLDGKVKIVKSKSTGKIRNVYLNGKHILSMRAQDGLFTLKLDGAKILHAHYAFPRFRVTVRGDVSRFIREGKNVFSKFVVECDPNLRPFDECLIVSDDDTLLGVGRCLLNREEMLSFGCGIAVKTREGIKDGRNN